MSSPVEPSEILTWPQALVAVVVVLAVLVVPQVIGLVQNGSIKRRADTAAHQLTNNSGSTVKDSIDRIETMLVGHIEQADRRDAERDARLAELESAKGRRV